MRRWRSSRLLLWLECWYPQLKSYVLRSRGGTIMWDGIGRDLLRIGGPFVVTHQPRMARGHVSRFPLT
jgi:hypothetical protein